MFCQVPAPAYPAQVLFELGAKDEAAGRLERAKLALVTLASTYSSSPLTAKARVELGGIYMFMEARAQVQSGRTSAANDTFRVLVRVYPDSPLAQRADEAARSLGIPPDPRR